MTPLRPMPPFSDLFGCGRNTARSGTEWESVMVQITLAFVIILGYLISKGVTESQNLAAVTAQLQNETALLQKQNADLQNLVVEFSNTEAGRERVQRIEVQRQLQMQKLLNRWLKVRGQRLFYRLVQQYRNAELIQLSGDLASLPIESSFQELNLEIDRIFLSGTEKVSPVELESLMNQVLTAEGYEVDAAPQLLEELSPEVSSLLDNSRTPTRENLTLLRLHIEGDLNSERGELVQIQYALVEKIADTRRKKLLALPLQAGGDMPAEDTDTDLGRPDLGRVVLERILNELRQEMRLLPETADLIRGTGDATPVDDQN